MQKLHKKQISNLCNLLTHMHKRTHTPCSNVWTDLSVQKCCWLQNRTAKWTNSVNFEFIKIKLIGTYWHHFLKMNRWCLLTHSHLPYDLAMGWSWNQGCNHFLSYVFNVSIHFVFSFIVFHLKIWHCFCWQLTEDMIPEMGFGTTKYA